MTSRIPTLAMAVAVAGGTALAGCSSSGSTPTTTQARTATSGASATMGTIPTADRSAAGTVGAAPTITVPSGMAPTTLETADLITGTGPVAKAGDTVTVQYVLATYSSGNEIQSSWTSQPFTFALGEGQVIKGWDEGVAGMKAGGRRELIIPPSLGYGDRSPGSGIAANDTLVFIVDLLSVNGQS